MENRNPENANLLYFCNHCLKKRLTSTTGVVLRVELMNFFSYFNFLPLIFPNQPEYC